MLPEFGHPRGFSCFLAQALWPKGDIGGMRPWHLDARTVASASPRNGEVVLVDTMTMLKKDS